MSSAARSGGPPPKRPLPRPSSLPRRLGLSTFHKCKRSEQSEGVAVLRQRIRGVAVPTDLPVPELFLVRERDGAHPLRALVRIALRDEEPHRSAVFDRERFPVPLVREENVGIVQDIEGMGCRIAVATSEGRETSGRPNLRSFRHFLDRDSDPLVVERGPTGDAVERGHHFRGRKAEQLVVREADRLVHPAVYPEVPLLRIEPRDDAQVEPRPFPDLPLSRREEPPPSPRGEALATPRI